MSLADICDARQIGRTTVNSWIASDEAYRQEYARARDAGCDARADNLRRIAESETMDRDTRKLVLDNERWLLARQAPLKFGDRTALQMLDENGKPAKAGITIIVDGAPGE